MTRRFLALAALFWAAPAFAADPAGGLDYTAPSAPAPPNPVALVVRLIGLTAGLVALGAGVVWMSRRANRVASAKGDAGRMKHMGTLALDRRSAVHLIRVDGQSVAVTTDATGIRSIVVLSEPFEVALGAAENDAARTA